MKTLARLAALALAFCACASANAIALTPVKLEVYQGQRAASLGIKNESSVARTYDVRIFGWSGTGKEGALLEKSDAVITSKPVITIPPFGTATIRVAVVSRSGLPSDYYRVIVEDISPESQNADVAEVRVRFSLPLQVTNKRGAKGSLAPVAGGFKNVGDAAVNITGTTRYVLPGETWLTKDEAKSFAWTSGIQ